MSHLVSVLKSKMCAGCGLCSETAEGMEIDKYGFARPIQPISDVLSEECCPGIKLKQCNTSSYNSLWGPVLDSIIGYASDSKLRQMGSSGGAITALLTYCLEQGQIDAVIQIGASNKNPLKNVTKIVQDKEELLVNAGSRYAPSSPLSLMRSLRGNGKKYVFVGKPCDVAALRTAVSIHVDLKEQYPLMISFMCAGVPSELATKEILNIFSMPHEDVVDFRYRGDGWPGLTKAVDSEGRIVTMTYNESWGTILNKKLQTRCKICADGTGESADIVCADAWHKTRNGQPLFDESSEGRSLILIRTEEGRVILEAAKLDGFITVEDKYPLLQLVDIQPYQANRKQTVLARLLALKMCGINATKYEGYNLLKLMFISSPIMQVKAFLGTIIRVVKGRM